MEPLRNSGLAFDPAIGRPAGGAFQRKPNLGGGTFGLCRRRRSSAKKSWLFLKLETDAALADDIIDRIPWRGGPVFGTAIEAINMALHDRIDRGMIRVSEAPGLGVRIKEQDFARFPYEPMKFRQYRHADGSWKGW